MLVEVIDRKSCELYHMLPSVTDDHIEPLAYLNKKKSPLEACLFIKTVHVVMYFRLSYFCV